MTTVEPNGLCKTVNDTTQVQQQKNNNDYDIQGGNATPHVYVGVNVHHGVREVLWKTKMAGAEIREWMI